MRRFRSARLGIGLVFFGVVGVRAQLGLDLNYATVWDGNAFKNYEALSDVVHQPRATLFYEHVGETQALRLFYEGSVFLFETYSDRRYFSHQLGLTGQRYLGESGTQLSWGLQGGQRFNQEAYAYYDYRHAEGYLNLLWDSPRLGQWTVGGQLRYRNYNSLSEFNFLESLAFIRGSVFLRTRTTVIGRVQLGRKGFTEPLLSEEVVTETVGTGGQGRGHGQGGGTSTTVTRVVQVESAQDAVLQWTAALRLAQSLGSRTGLAVEGSAQRGLDGGGRVLSGQDGGYESEDELFDDPYSYDMDEFTGELTQMLPWNSRLRLGAAYAKKRYDRWAYDLEGNVLEDVRRADELRWFWASLQKTVAVKHLLKGLVFSLDFIWLDNRSNDAYYDYDNRMTQLGCQLSF